MLKDRTTRMLATRMLVALLVAASVWVAGSPTPVAAANDTIAALGVAPLFPQAEGLTARADVHLTLRRKARLTITIRRPSGKVVRTLARDVRFAAGDHVLSWDGRNANGTLVKDGAYRAKVVATNSLGTVKARRDFRKGLPAIYTANPGAIVVTLDPGHGGIYPGASSDGSHEKDFNLDIALRLRALLEPAGVQVVMTRTTDTEVNLPAVDVNGDGSITSTDDLAARNDVANLARADLSVAIHNNAAGCICYRGTELFTSKKRSWTPEGLALANLVQREHVAALGQFRDSTYYPIDRGVKSGNYYIMSPYDSVVRPRPSLMPTLLTESLFVNSTIELPLLRRADVRQSIAIAFYIGIARYLNSRPYGIRYELLAGPSAPIAAGSVVPYSVRVTNRGNVTSSGWKLELRAVAAVPLYDGTEQLGELIGSAAIPNGLAPGQSVDVALTATAPSVGAWLVKADILLPTAERSHTSRRGVAPLQFRLQTTD